MQAVEVGLDFLWASVGGAALGFFVFVIVAKLRKLVTDPLMDTAISLVTPFAAYLLAEELESSGVISVVVAGLLLGHKAPIIQTAQSRIAERINWRTIAFLLENTVFLLIGLQARWILEGVADSELSPARIAAVCARHPACDDRAPDARGSSSPATAWSAQDRTTHREVPPWQVHLHPRLGRHARRRDPGRRLHHPRDRGAPEVLLLIAFTVVAGTLFIQGLSLPWVARRLAVPSPDPLEDALARAALLQQASKAGFIALKEMENDDPHGVYDLIRQRVDQRNFAAWEQLSTTPGQESPSDLYARARLEMIDAERKKVLEIRSTGTVPSDVVREVLNILDVEESMLDIATADDETTRLRARASSAPAHRATTSTPPAPPSPFTVEDGLVCQQCVELGDHWVSLRRCLACGNIACCDSSPAQARHRALPRLHPRRHAVRPAGRGLALVLRAPPHRLTLLRTSSGLRAPFPSPRAGYGRSPGPHARMRNAPPHRSGAARRRTGCCDQPRLIRPARGGPSPRSSSAEAWRRRPSSARSRSPSSAG